MNHHRSLRVLRRILAIAAGSVIAFVLIASCTAALIVRDRLATLRAIEADAKPVPAVMKHALLTNDPNLFEKREFSLRAFLPSTRNVVRCAPTTALLVVRDISPRGRALRWHIETYVVTAAATYAFTPDELLRIHAHGAYFARINGVQVYGIEAASAAYFRKASRDLTTAEAAMLVGILPSPNALSPFKDPAVAMERRDRVLAQMFARGSIDEAEFKAAVSQRAPLPPDA